MLVKLYSQLLIMSFIAGGLYLVLKILSKKAIKIFTSTWHYYTYLFLFTFFIIPYQKLSKWINLEFLKTKDKFNLYSIETLLLCSEKMVETPNRVGISSLINLNVIPYLFIIGTITFISIHLIKGFNIRCRILKVCRPADDTLEAFKVLYDCRQKLGIKKEIPILY